MNEFFGFSRLRIIGVIHLIFVFALLYLLPKVNPFIWFLWPLLLIVVLYYSITGYRLIKLRQRSHILTILSTIINILFLLWVFSTSSLLTDEYITFTSVFATLGVFIALNIFILYLLSSSLSRTQNNESAVTGRVTDIVPATHSWRNGEKIFLSILFALGCTLVVGCTYWLTPHQKKEHLQVFSDTTVTKLDATTNQNIISQMKDVYKVSTNEFFIDSKQSFPTPDQQTLDSFKADIKKSSWWGADSLVSPTNNILLGIVSLDHDSRLRSYDGIVQYNIQTHTFEPPIKVVTRPNRLYTDAFSFDMKQGIAVLTETYEKEYSSIKMSTEQTFFLFNSEFPEGIKIAEIQNPPSGKFTKYLWQDKDTLFLLTEERKSKQQPAIQALLTIHLNGN